MNKEKITERLPFWSSLSNAEKELVAGNAVTRTFDKGALLHGRGESCMGMIFVLSGSARVQMISEEGREITLFRLKEGDSCVLSASCVMSQITFETIMVAAESTEVLIINAGVYSDLMERNISVKCFTFEIATERFSSVVRVMQQLLFMGMDGRLAYFLLEQSAETGKDEIPMTQEEVAVEINSAREVVARTIKRFAGDGLIEVKRGMITIRDRSGLKRAAGR